MDKNLKKIILDQQRNEITEHIVYTNLAKRAKNPKNKKILQDIADDELKHHNFWKSITKKNVSPKKFQIWKYSFFARFLGLTFSLRLMEKGETNAQDFYNSVAKDFPKVIEIRKEEEKHEKKLIGILNDERLTYAGAIVLGLNDALVELTGTLAGLSIAFQNSTLIGITGIIMGIAASLSMTASGYLSSKEDEKEHDKNPIKSAMYTGLAYILTVVLLVAPYFIFTSNVNYALISMLIVALLVIALYTFYISIAKDLSFWKRFTQMAVISLGVAVISFGIGILVKTFFGINIQ